MSASYDPMMEPCAICGTHLVVTYNDNGESWRCECGRTAGVRLNKGALDLGIDTLAGRAMESLVVDDPMPEAPFVHDAVFARYPKGTDPRAAIRDAMGVFMERTDDTNALPPPDPCRIDGYGEQP